MKWKEWFEYGQNEARWVDSDEKGVLKAEFLNDFVLRIWFEEKLDVSIYELDFYPLLFEESRGKALVPLKDKNRFRLVKGDYALVWIDPETGEYDENAIDIAPECIRFFCEKHGKLIKALKKRRLELLDFDSGFPVNLSAFRYFAW